MSEEVRKDDRIVDKVRVVVHTTGAWPNGRMSDNHWSVYLILANGEGSVRMNMWAAIDDPTGHLEWSPSLAYTMSNSAIKNWDYKTVSGISVKKIYSVVLNNGRDKYEMSGGGSGCRYWVYIIVKDLDGEAFLKEGAATDLWEKLLHQYSNTGHTKPLAMVKGTFTSQKSKASAAHSASSASASASASAPASTAQTSTGARTQVSVRSFQANGQLCYSWKKDGVEDRSYAKDWTSFTDKTGKPGVFHKGKNIFSLAP